MKTLQQRIKENFEITKNLANKIVKSPPSRNSFFNIEIKPKTDIKDFFLKEVKEVKVEKEYFDPLMTSSAEKSQSEALLMTSSAEKSQRSWSKDLEKKEKEEEKKEEKKENLIEIDLTQFENIIFSIKSSYPNFNPVTSYEYKNTEFQIDIEGKLTIKNFCHALNDRNNIIYGRMQEGKTTLSAINLMCISLFLKCPVIWFTQNHMEDSRQLETIFQEIKKEFSIDIPIFHVPTMKNKNKEFEISLRNEIPSIFICVGNENRSKNILKSLEKQKNSTTNFISKFVVAIDEADKYWPDCDSKFSKIVNQIFQMSFIRFLVTATQLDVGSVFYEEKVVAHIVRPKNNFRYIGIHNIKHTEFNIDQQKLKKEFPTFFNEQHDNLIIDRIKYIEIKRKHEKINPVIVLGIHSLKNKVSEKLCIKVAKLCPNWYCIEYNQNGTIIRYNENGRIKMEKTTGIREAISIASEISSGAGSSCGAEISSIPGKKRYIYITGGRLFDRGINFVSKDYTCHPTDMIYTMKATKNAVIDGQRIGRLFGIEKRRTEDEKYHRVLHCDENIYKKIIDLVDANKKFVQEIKNNPNIIVRNSIKNVKTCKRQSTGNLSKSKLEINFTQLDKLKTINTEYIQVEILNEIQEEILEIPDKRFLDKQLCCKISGSQEIEEENSIKSTEENSDQNSLDGDHKSEFSSVDLIKDFFIINVPKKGTSSHKTYNYCLDVLGDRVNTWIGLKEVRDHIRKVEGKSGQINFYNYKKPLSSSPNYQGMLCKKNGKNVEICFRV
jgi:hypothetical protein